MESKWFIIIAMILSFLYKKYKERQEMKEGVESESEKESMWNMEDFVAKLERQFNPNSGNETSTSTPKPHRAVVEVEPVFRKEEMMDSNPEYSEEFASHKAEFQSKKEILDLKKEEESIETEIPYNLDLEKMIVSQVILHRPEY
jgi:hypothetical protein